MHKTHYKGIFIFRSNVKNVLFISSTRKLYINTNFQPDLFKFIMRIFDITLTCIEVLEFRWFFIFFINCYDNSVCIDRMLLQKTEN